MEVILRRILIYGEDPAQKNSIGYRAMSEVDVVTATANAASCGTLDYISVQYKWPTQNLLSASKKVNRRKQLAVIQSTTPKLILVPKCIDVGASKQYISEMVDEISELDCKVVSITHLAFIKNLQNEHVDLILSMLKKIKETKVKIVYLDIENNWYENMQKSIDEVEK